MIGIGDRTMTQLLEVLMNIFYSIVIMGFSICVSITSAAHIIAKSIKETK